MNGKNVKTIGLVDFFEQYVETFNRGKNSADRVTKYELVASPEGPKKNGLSKTTVEDQYSIIKSAILKVIDMRYLQITPTRNVKLTGRAERSFTQPR
ncbi:hypothetical protein NRIC_12280 [Enterococcus florum]|uniref:Uncharacterized protein n=1 Tax=Enterococcus florum TaxID=2480627 RepID=A0A4P5P623_9ENTE|nr:hypothetical protein NRIC_12280 [Enterococcus florum]